MSDLLQTLQNMEMLQGISAAELEQIVAISEEVEFSEGAVIFRENNPAENIFLIVDGSVSLEICAPGVGCRKILTVGQGQLLGCSPILENARYTATARAMSAVRAIRMQGRNVLALCEADPRLGYRFMQRAAIALAKRLDATRLQLLNVFDSELVREAPEHPSSKRE
ncbi:MAG: cyclic nucleotide-binding domain-containing protein [Planctomycetales bacterium]|nr:cyclic nucleotide-binding domain-containing protein [Planctomycetales bacterium]